MSQPTRKRQYQQQSPPAVKEEQQEQEEEAQSIGTGISGQCSSSNFGDNNTIGTAAAGGNGGDDMNQLQLKIAALEAKNQILEGKLENQDGILANLKQENLVLWMTLKEMEDAKIENKKMMDEFGKRMTALEAKHQQEIAAIKALPISAFLSQKQYEFAQRPQRQQHQPNLEMPDCVVVNIPDSQSQQGTSKNSEEIQHIQPQSKSVTPNLVPCHSANLPDFVNMPQSQGNLNTLDERLCALVSRQPKQTTRAASTALNPPLKSVIVNPVPCHSAQQPEEEEEVIVVEEIETKRLCNPLGNGWNPHTCKATIKITLPDQLSVHNSSPNDWGNLVARKGFPLAACRPQQNNFAGPILYYYEITAKSPLLFNEGRFCIGFSSGSIPKDSWIGRTPNTYAMRDDKHDFCLLNGYEHFFDWTDGAIIPMLHGYGDVFGCGLVLSADDKLAIFFTANGTLMGKQFPFVHAGSILYPCAQLNRNVTVEANFGQKPFKYNIDQCPGLQFQW